MEVLPRAVHPVLQVQVLTRRPVAGQLGEVGEQPRAAPSSACSGARRSATSSSRSSRYAVSVRPSSRGSTSNPSSIADRSLRSRSARAAGSTRERTAVRAARDRWSPATVSAATTSPSPTGSRRTSGAPVSTWLPAETSEFLDPRGERRVQHRLHLHRLQHQDRRTGGRPRRRPPPGSPPPAPGAGERSTPPSSRLTRWVTPSTSTSWTGPWVAVTSRMRAAADGQPALVLVDPIDLGVDGLLVVPVAMTTRNRCGPVRDTVSLYAVPRSLRSIARPCGAAPADGRRGRSRSGGCRSTASSVSYASMPAATSATPECRWATSRPSPRTRSIQPVSALPSMTSGAVEQVEDEALVRRAALDHDRGLVHRPAQSAPAPRRGRGRTR